MPAVVPGVLLPGAPGWWWLSLLLARGVGVGSDSHGRSNLARSSSRVPLLGAVTARAAPTKRLLMEILFMTAKIPVKVI